jgi:hypothetical protein
LLSGKGISLARKRHLNDEKHKNVLDSAVDEAVFSGQSGAAPESQGKLGKSYRRLIKH